MKQSKPGKARQHARTVFHFCASVSVALSVFSLTATASDTQLHDRRAYMAPGTSTSDDPRRIPSKPVETTGVETVFAGGRVLNVVDGTVQPATVVVQGNRIKAVLPPDISDWAPDARIIDVAGKTVMPGLIDMHVHVTYPDRDTPVDKHTSEGTTTLLGQRNLRYFLESGFTSVRDVNGVGDAPYVLSEWSAVNAIPAPRVFTGGHIITGTGGHATERPIHFAWEADGADAWRAAVRRTFKKGASVIKIASHFSAEEVAAAVDEAHLLGLKITCDCETIYTDMAIEAGVDMIEHPLPRSDEAIAMMAEKGITAIPTLQVYQNLIDRVGGYYGSTSRRFTLTSQSMFDVLKKMKAAGVIMGVGSDTIGEASRSVPNIYIADLKWLVKAGYSIPQALQAATIINARLLDMDDKIGSLEAGKLADLIVVDGRPDENLDDLRKVEIVVKDGIMLVQSGMLVTPPHVPVPLARPSPPDYVR